MRVNQIIAVVLGVLLMIGCNDQFWCGDDGCAGKKPSILETVSLATNFAIERTAV